MRLLRALLGFVILIPLFGPPAAAGVGMSWWQFVTTANQNITFDDCNARAARALTAAGLSQERHNGSSGSAGHAEWFGSSSGPSSAYISCFAITANTTTVTFVIASIPNADGTHEASAVMQKIRDAFFGTASPSPGLGISGKWSLTSNCGWTNPAWASTVTLIQAADGTLSGSIQNDSLNPEILADTSAGWNSNPPAMRSQYSGSTMTLVVHPAGWISVLELTGQFDGSVISGTAHHYTSDDCTFRMTRS